MFVRLDFISGAANTNNDTIIRILCINYGYYSSTTDNPRATPDDKLLVFIQNERKHDRLNSVSYNDIREHCSSKSSATIFKSGIEDYISLFSRCMDDFIDVFFNPYDQKISRRVEGFIEAASLLLISYIGIPIYGLSRIFTILYPYILVFYIYYYNLFFKLDLFELTMLGVYIFLQWVTFIFGLFVFRTHLWLWHILPGKRNWQMGWNNIDTKKVLEETYKYYDEIQWLPFATQIVLQRFGKDIGGIVVDYLKAMNQLKV